MHGEGMPEPGADPPQPQAAAMPKWRHRIWTICFAIFCLEIGAFLAVFPWLDSWHLNHFPAMFPLLTDLWDDPYLRGAVSGLGLVNLMIAASQVNRLLRQNR
jgi:hypothetical protein